MSGLAKRLAEAVLNHLAYVYDGHMELPDKDAIATAIDATGILPRWRSVEDEMPPKLQDVMVSGGGDVFEGVYDPDCEYKGDWFDTDSKRIYVKYWQPKPAPPEPSDA